MKYYFDTQEQIDGDEAYNANNYIQALGYYKKGLNNLHQLMARDRGFIPTPGFRDGLCYVLGEIIITSADLLIESVEDTLNHQEVISKWNEISSFLTEMEEVFEQVKLYVSRQTTDTHIQMIYKALANACEAIGDAIIDELEGEYFAEALPWIKKAISFKTKAGLDIDIELHLNYLNLLEQGFKSTDENRYLVKMQNYLSTHPFETDGLPVLQQLEILSYQILVAMQFEEQTVNTLIEQAKGLYDQCDKDDEEGSVVLEDIEHLIATHAHNMESHDTSFEGHADFEEETDLEESLNPLEMPDTTDRVLSPASDLGAMEIAESSKAPNLLAPPSAPISIRQAPMTFFGSPKSQRVSSKNPCDAFVETMNKCISHYPRDQKFLSNILSLIGDFYFKNKKTLPLKDTPIIAWELYGTALLLNKEHKVAKYRQSKIYGTDQPMIESNYRFGGDVNQQLRGSAMHIFQQAMENHSAQIQALLSTNEKLAEKIIDKLLTYVTHKMIEKKIAGDKSSLIASEIRLMYNTALSSGQSMSPMMSM